MHESDFCLIKGFCCFPISIQYGKCLETGEKSKHLKGCFGPRVSDVFWIKRILLFSLFLDTFSCSKEFAVSLFPDTFSVQRILLFPCFQTLSIFKGFWRFPVSRHFNFSKVSGNRKNNQIHWENHYCQGILSFLLFIDTFWIQKCQETEKQPNPLKKSLFSRDFPVSGHFWLQKKMSKTWETTISLEKNGLLKIFWRFSCF